MKKLLVVLLALVISSLAFAQEKGKSKPATPATPPKEAGQQKATPATPSPKAEHGMEMKAKNMEKKEAKKEAVAEKKEDKKESKAAAKDAKKEAKAAKKAAKKAAQAEKKNNR